MSAWTLRERSLAPAKRVNRLRPKRISPDSKQSQKPPHSLWVLTGFGGPSVVRSAIYNPTYNTTVCSQNSRLLIAGAWTTRNFGPPSTTALLLSPTLSSTPFINWVRSKPRPSLLRRRRCVGRRPIIRGRFRHLLWLRFRRQLLHELVQRTAPNRGSAVIKTPNPKPNRF